MAMEAVEVAQAEDVSGSSPPEMKLAQAKRVLLAKWKVTERLPKNAGLFWPVDVYWSL